MRTLQLLNALSDKELIKINAIVKGQKRKTLVRLYDALKKYRNKQDLPGNQQLFAATFEKPYAPDRNYLLRNELRLLNELIYDHLIKDTFNTYLAQHKNAYNTWLLRSFYQRNMYAIFNAEADRYIPQALESTEPYEAAQMLEMKSLWQVGYEARTPENLQNHMELLNVLKHEHARQLRYRLRECEARAAFIQHRVDDLKGTYIPKPLDYRTPPVQSVDINTLSGEDSFEHYLILKKHSYQTKVHFRIGVLKEMLAFEAARTDAGDDGFFRSYIATLSNIAMEYILLGEFEEANEYLKRSIAKSDELKLPLMPGTIQNYIGNQINIAQYQKGIDLYKRVEAQIVGNRNYVSICLYKGYCHLFLQQADEALDALPTDAQLTHHQNLMFRMIYLIAFIIRKDHSLAMNECKNMNRMVRANEGPYYRNYEWIVSLFLRYISADGKSKAARKAALRSVIDELEQDSRTENLLITEFSLRWLSVQLHIAQ